MIINYLANVKGIVLLLIFVIVITS